jgi:hypothetical protein
MTWQPYAPPTISTTEKLKFHTNAFPRGHLPHTPSKFYRICPPLNYMVVFYRMDPSVFHYTREWRNGCTQPCIYSPKSVSAPSRRTTHTINLWPEVRVRKRHTTLHGTRN